MQYIARASVDFNWLSKDLRSFFPRDLPQPFGAFRLGQSPNAEHFLADLGWIDPPPVPVNPSYPVSYVYVDLLLDSGDDSAAFHVANQQLATLESLLRLFQSGGIFVRRHSLWNCAGVEPARVEEAFSILDADVIEIRPAPPKLEKLRDYDLTDERLHAFIEFFSRYWAVCNSSKAVEVPLYRFTESAEWRHESERLIDLIICLESVLVDGAGEITYRLAARAAAFMEPPGAERERIFQRLQKLYGQRSKILHGDSLDAKKLADFSVDDFEDFCRALMVKWLDSQVKAQLLKPAAFDSFLLKEYPTSP